MDLDQRQETLLVELAVGTTNSSYLNICASDGITYYERQK